MTVSVEIEPQATVCFTILNVEYAEATNQTEESVQKSVNFSLCQKCLYVYAVVYVCVYFAVN